MTDTKDLEYGIEDWMKNTIFDVPTNTPGS